MTKKVLTLTVINCYYKIGEVILREINIKNRTSYYLDELIIINDFGFQNILLDERSFEDNFLYNLCVKSIT